MSGKPVSQPGPSKGAPCTSATISSGKNLKALFEPLPRAPHDKEALFTRWTG